LPTVNELFDLRYGHSLELNRLEVSDAVDAVNFVSRTTRNNGVSARVSRIAGIVPAEAGTLSVALGGQGGAAQSFVQPFPYYCGRDVMVLTPKGAMSEAEKLWWSACISANHYRFGFGRQANRTLKDLALPSRNIIPSWVAIAAPDQFEGADKKASDVPTPRLEAAKWTRYSISDLFDIRKGKRLTKANMLPGTIPFIGAIEKNNGVSAFVQSALHRGNTITVNYNGSVAEAFYQPIPFWCSDDVNVLYPRFTLTPEKALFVCTVVRLERYRFSYGRKWHLERMKMASIRLPSDADGAPDWTFMESYIKSLPFSSQIGSLRDVRSTLEIDQREKTSMHHPRKASTQGRLQSPHTLMSEV